jgi:uncharacterized protein (DUF3084 family)
MLEEQNLIYTLITGELVTLLILIFRSYPVVQSKIIQLESDRKSEQQRIQILTDEINRHSIQLAEAKKERDSLRSELNENKEVMKDAHREFREAMQENTKAITQLDTTLKHILQGRPGIL